MNVSLAHPPLAEPSPFPLLYSYLIFPILCSLSCVCGPTTHIVSPFPLSFLSYCRYLSLSHTHTCTCTNNLFPLPLYTPFPFYTPIPHPHTLHSFSNSYLSIPWRIREWPKLLRKRSSPVWKWVHQLAALVLPTNLLGNPYRYLLSVRLIFIFNMTDFTSSCRNILIEVTKL